MNLDEEREARRRRRRRWPEVWGKRVENAWRAAWIRVLSRLLRRPAAAPPSWESGSHRVLFLRHDRAGDMIVSTALLRAIARAQPTVALDVLASPANASILAHSPHVRRVVMFDKRRAASYIETIRALRAARYDAVIDCMVTAPSLTTLLLMAATGARYTIGIAGRGRDDAINLPVPGAPHDAHMVEKIGRLGAAFGIDPASTDWSPVIELSPDERDVAHRQWADAGPAGAVRVLVNISAGTVARRWPDDRYIAVIQHIRALAGARPLVVLVMAAPDELARASGIAAATSSRVAVSLSLRTAVALVAESQFVFTPDTSIAHAASAFKRPCVDMLEAGKMNEWRLYGTAGETLPYRDLTIETLSVADVEPAVERVFGRVLSGAP